MKRGWGSRGPSRPGQDLPLLAHRETPAPPTGAVRLGVPAQASVARHSAANGADAAPANARRPTRPRSSASTATTLKQPWHKPAAFPEGAPPLTNVDFCDSSARHRSLRADAPTTRVRNQRLE